MQENIDEKAIKRSFPRSFSQASTNSEGSTPTNAEPIVIVSSEELNKLVELKTRVAFSELAIIILKLDFDETDDDAHRFQSNTIKLILKNADLPKNVSVSVDGLNENIASQIEIIKSDPYIVKHTAVCLLSSLLVTFLKDGIYDSRMRVLLRHLSAFFGVDFESFAQVEDALVGCLIEGYKETERERKQKEKANKFKKIKRFALIGTTGAVGGILIGLTGGLAAPLVAAGAGFFVGTGVVSGLATATGAAIFGSAFGVAGASLTGYKMHKRVGAIDEFQIEKLSEGYSLHCALVVSGWIKESDEEEERFKSDWRHLQLSTEQYTLRYESKYLIELGQAIEYFVSVAASYALQSVLMQTALAGVLTALAWPIVLVSASNVIDNPWNVMISRSSEVGEELAEVLIQRSQGNRPVTLIGFSLGARVIFHALIAMSKRENYKGIVEDVVLLGAPVSASPKQWAQISQVCGGRIINGYCTTDWLLKFLYRTMSVQFSIAGTSPVNTQKNRKIVNFNLSHIIKSHFDYAKKLPEILNAVGVKTSPRSEASSNDLKAYCEKQDKDKKTDDLSKNMEQNLQVDKEHESPPQNVNNEENKSKFTIENTEEVK